LWRLFPAATILPQGRLSSLQLKLLELCDKSAGAGNLLTLVERIKEPTIVVHRSISYVMRRLCSAPFQDWG